MNPAPVIGLTGGIASGKTTASDAFASLGIPIIDADQIAHQLVEPGQPALSEIIAAFAPDVIFVNGALDRKALGRLVFLNPGARRHLERILHPRIREQIEARLRQPAKAPYRLLVAPLLFEAGLDDLSDRNLVIDCPEEVQMQRLLARDGLDERQARAMLQAQMDRASRRKAADDIITNHGDREHLIEQIRKIHQQYQRLQGNGH